MPSTTSPSEIYRFAAVRATSTHPSDALMKRFILLASDSDVAKMRAAFPNSALFNLDALNEFPVARLKVLVEQEKRASKLALEPEDLPHVFPIDADAFFGWRWQAVRS